MYAPKKLQEQSISANEDLKLEIEEIQQTLNREVEYKTKMFCIICRVKWNEQGEKSNKYF